MRVLIATDKFAGTMSAVQAAAAISAGWRRHAPRDEIDCAPMSDGGPGFVDVLNSSLAGRLLTGTVRGPHGEPTPVTLLTLDDGETGYVESAQACGLHLTGGRGAEQATTYGVGEMIAALVDDAMTQIVVGLGGSGTNDGGAGMLAALGATADVPLDQGGAALEGVREVDVSAVRERLRGVRLVAATDVDNPLTGLFGATKNFGPQKGISEDRLPLADQHLERFARVLDQRTSLAKGAGAGGGLGYGLLVCAAVRESGIDLVAESTRLLARARSSDLVITGEGAFDFSSRAGKVPYGVAQIAERATRPCIVMAGQVLVGSREMRALGIESAYSLVEMVGQERAFAAPEDALADLAERVARTWSR